VSTLSFNLLAKSKNKGETIITRGMQPSRPPSLKMERYTRVEEEVLSVNFKFYIIAIR